MRFYLYYDGSGDKHELGTKDEAFEAAHDLFETTTGKPWFEVWVIDRKSPVSI